MIVTNQCKVCGAELCAALVYSAIGIGDPHFITFDNKLYHFQEPGDFVDVELLSTDGSVMFQIQGRHGEICPEGGGCWEGVTGHKAVALGEPGGVGFEVRENADDYQ